MKKITLVICSLVFFTINCMNTTLTSAEEIQSKVEVTILPPNETTDSDVPTSTQPTTDSESKTTKEESYLKLPQLGEKLEWKLPLMVIIIVVGTLLVTVMKRRIINEKK